MRAVKIGGQFVRNLICAVLPRSDNGGGTLVIGDKTVVVVHGDLIDLLFRFVKEGLFRLRYKRIANGNGGAGYS